MANFFIVFASVIFLTPNFSQAAQPGDHVCGSHLFANRELKYCIDYGDRAHNKDILYVYHGSNGSEQDWVQAPDNIGIENAWKNRGIPAPTKITLSFGDEWMLTETVHIPQAAPYHVIVDQVMPYLESLIHGKINHRFLKGVSMGGWNGVQLLLKNGELFDRVALICPVISTLGPFSTDQEINDYIAKGNGAIERSWVVDDLLNEERGLFPTREEWNQHDPLQLVKYVNIKTPQVYLSCGDKDQYGFFNGTRMFAEIAAKRGVNVIWSPKHGGHCTIDSDELATFFAP